jgi:hypothetical protein
MNFFQLTLNNVTRSIPDFLFERSATTSQRSILNAHHFGRCSPVIAVEKISRLFESKPGSIPLVLEVPSDNSRVSIAYSPILRFPLAFVLLPKFIYETQDDIRCSDFW